MSIEENSQLLKGIIYNHAEPIYIIDGTVYHIDNVEYWNNPHIHLVNWKIGKAILVLHTYSVEAIEKEVANKNFITLEF